MSLFKDISELFAPTIDGLGNEAIVKAAYQDLLGYSDADTMDNAQARIDYWVGELNSGLSTANFGEQFLSEAETSQGSLITATTFKNNKTVVQAHRDELEANPDATIAELKTVASTNRVDDVVSGSDSGTSGETFTLTTSTDDFTGESTDDAFNATNETLSSSDTIDGGDGNDTLAVTNTATTYSLPATDATSIEQLDVTNSSTSTDGSEEVATVTFSELKAGQFFTLGDETYINVSGDQTAAEVASGFKNQLSNSTLPVSGTGNSDYTVSDGPNATQLTFTANDVGNEVGLVIGGNATEDVAQVNIINSSGAESLSGGDTVSLDINGTTATTVVSDSNVSNANADAAVASAIAETINATIGSSIATAAGDDVQVVSSSPITIGNFSFTDSGTANLTTPTVSNTLANGTQVVSFAGSSFGSGDDVSFTLNGEAVDTSATSFSGASGNSDIANAVKKAINDAYGATIATTSSAEVTIDAGAVGIAISNITMSGSATFSGAEASASEGYVDTTAPTISIDDGVADVASGTTTVDTDNLASASTFNVVDSISDVTVSNLEAGDTVGIIGNGAVTNGDTTFNYDSGVESLTLNVDGGTTAGSTTLAAADAKTLTVNSTGEANTIDGLTADDPTNLVIDADEALTVSTTFSASSAEKLTVTGDSLVTIDDTLDASIVEIDGSNGGGIDVDAGAVAEASTGTTDIKVTGSASADAVDLTAVAAAREIDVSLGDGDDEAILDAASVNSDDDSLDGGAGEDTVTYTAGTTLDAKFSDNVSGFETLKVDADTTSASITMDNLDEFSPNNFVIAGGDTSGGDTGDATYNMNGLAAGAVISLAADEGALTQSADADGVAVSASLETNGSADSITFNAAESYESLSDGNDEFESVTVNYTEASSGSIETIDFGGATSLTLNASGKKLTSGAITLDSSSGDGVVDASNSSAELDLTFAADIKEFTGGSGKTTVTLNAGDLDNTGTFVGGSGEDDVLKASSAAGASVDFGAINVSEFETIEITSATTNTQTTTADLRNVQGLETVKVVATDAIAGGNGDLFVLDRIGQNVSVELGSTMTSLSLSKASGAVQDLEVTGSFELDNLGLGSGIETLNITADDGNDTADEANLNLDGLTTTALETVNVLGSDKADLGTLATTVTTADASASSGKLTVTASATGTTITGGSVADAITGGAGVDTIRGGEGNDVINGAGGADILAYEADGATNGKDTITLNAADVHDFSAFSSNLSVDQNGGSGTAINEYVSTGTSDVDITNKIVLLGDDDSTDGDDAEVDTASKIAALIDGSGDVFSIQDGGKAVIAAGDVAVTSSGADELAHFYMVHDIDGDGTVGGNNEVTLVGVSNADFDLDTLTADSFA